MSATFWLRTGSSGVSWLSRWCAFAAHGLQAPFSVAWGPLGPPDHRATPGALPHGRTVSEGHLRPGDPGGGLTRRDRTDRTVRSRRPAGCFLVGSSIFSGSRTSCSSLASAGSGPSRRSEGLRRSPAVLRRRSRRGHHPGRSVKASSHDYSDRGTQLSMLEICPSGPRTVPCPRRPER